MTAGPSISVVVPFFDSDPHIRACIQSLLCQEGVRGSYEVILINNGSTDRSASIVAEYDGLTVLDEATPGAYAARNRGISQSKAALLAFTDADCEADPDWLRTIQGGMEDPATAILVGCSRYPRAASVPLRMLGVYENAKAEYVVRHCPPSQQFAYANNMAVRASVFNELGPFKEWTRAADSELVHRLAARRPDLRLAYNHAMRVTHLEFLGARARARRLSLYSRTNSKIPTFQELGLTHRLGIAGQLVRQLWRR